MRNVTNIALGLILAASSLSAQSGMTQAPVPGPYMIIPRQQPAMPAFTPRPFAMPMPYWMQNTRQQQARPAAPTQTQPTVGRSNQQPANTGWNTAPTSQSNGAGPNASPATGPITGQTTGQTTGPTPGFFPSYNSGQPQGRPRPQQPAPNNAARNTYAPMPWGQAGQQGFMPMPAPWPNGQWQNGQWQNGQWQNGQWQNGQRQNGQQQNGQWQNGWGNNWNNNGYGYGSGQGYAAPNQARR